MNTRATVTICFHVEGVGEYQLSLDEETMTFSLSGEIPGVCIPDDLLQWDACESDQSRFARKVVRCLNEGRGTSAEARGADTDRVRLLLDALLNTALPS